ncbi:hypothetical protein BS50DRAFT_568590 [Corynespora cassiicola Philippines]|uniref:Uncharacterized protein n=1 Tax=Corynespora cassiicola Philippines TaxID=1448308 RepID=A0A2T2P5N2_CORCC|nr:hypothetical protein BS50DRAFT_568590 [Corynespora cassiicola Philippines]
MSMPTACHHPSPSPIAGPHYCIVAYLLYITAIPSRLVSAPSPPHQGLPASTSSQQRTSPALPPPPAPPIL